MSETATTRVAANVRAVAARRQLAQRQIAEALGISQQSVSRRWLGKHPLNVEELHRIADLCGVTPGSLLDGDESPPLQHAS